MFFEKGFYRITYLFFDSLVDYFFYRTCTISINYVARSMETDCILKLLFFLESSVNRFGCMPENMKFIDTFIFAIFLSFVFSIFN